MAEPTTTVWWSTAQHLVTLLRAHATLNGVVSVQPGWPGDLERKAEMVFIDELTSTEERPVMTSGRQIRKDEFTIPLLVVVAGRKDLDATMTRVTELVAAIEDVVADDPSLTAVEGVQMVWITSKSMSCGQTPEGPIGSARVVIDVTARLV